MNFRQRSKKYGEWVFVKFSGDACVYAACQNCGFVHPSSKEDETSEDFKIIPVTPSYKYCPMCGLKMKLSSKKVNRIK